MTRAAIYNRVSGDEQERHGTSLDTQADESLKYCNEKGYKVIKHFKGSESGLKLDRPLLNELRDNIRTGEIDVVVVYVLDRFTRDPNHGVILMDELEKHNVRLEGVAEDIQNTELGKLISYIKGFAAKLEAEKIKERTQRGKKAWAKQGRLSTGGFHNTFGYDYHKRVDDMPARRQVNRSEAVWVEQIFRWYVEDNLSLGAICDGLAEAGMSMTRSALRYILKNSAYCGRTFVNISNERFEIPEVTPRIVSDDIYEAAQRQLR